ncbi:tRNA-splicing endonuclease subunit Sen54-like [Apostichopus japonicus]|uniref:tRNA-splicing endonuclease subunit Sen54-like n=1 Tax=Stichopus japonicus TaxID=307972 RepID=UPI003AB17304
MDECERVDVLGPQDLVHYHKLDPHLPRSGIKAAEPDGSSAQAIRLSQMQAQQREILDEEKVAKFGSLSSGDWNHDLELIEVKSLKGKFWQTMGYNAGVKKYLYPEEGLFLMEMNAFEIRYHGVPMSLQQAYELLIPREFTLEEYQTYAYLMRLGYIVTRHKQCDVTEYEQRIKLYQQNSSRQKRACKKVQVWFDQMTKKIKVPNNSDSGDLTDESYYSSSSGNGFSVNSAGDLNTKVKQALQDLEEKCPSSEAEDGSNDNSSFYSDGPISQLSAENLEKVDSDFNYSVVNLLDYHQKHCSSSSEFTGKIVKRKHSSWYITKANGSSSGSSIQQGMKPAKVRRRDSWDLSKGLGWSQEQTNLPDHMKEEATTTLTKKEDKGKTKLQSSDLGSSDPSLCESSINIDEFLLTVVNQITDVKDRRQKSNNIKSRPYSTWNFTTIHIPDMGSRPLDPKLMDLPMKGAPPPPKVKKVEIISEKYQGGKGDDGSITSLNELTSGFHTSDSAPEQSLSYMLDKGSMLLNNRLVAPSNWMEYKEMMKNPEGDLDELLTSPVGHLWSGEVKPLVKPSDAVNSEALLKKLQVIQSAEVKEMSRSCVPLCKDVKIAFDVHLPDSSFKKTCPGKPAFHIVVFSIHDPVPDYSTQMSILQQTGLVPLLFAIVESADVMFCCFRDVQVPIDFS